MLKNQKGIIGPQVVMMIVIVVLAAGFTIFRITTTTDDRPEARVGDTPASTEDETQSVDDNLQETEQANTENGSQNAGGGNSSSPAGANEISFTKGGAGLNIADQVVSADLTLESAQTGTCSFLFSLGNTTVSDSTTISGDNRCQIDISVNQFPKNGSYTLEANFTSTDGQTTANIAGIMVDVTPDEFTFTKGGGNYDSGAGTVFVSQTAPTGHTGTCTYVFTNGNSRVERTNTIQNSRTCEISVPASEFPKSGNWLFDLTFNATDRYEVGTGGGFTITIN